VKISCLLAAIIYSQSSPPIIHITFYPTGLYTPMSVTQYIL